MTRVPLLQGADSGPTVAVAGDVYRFLAVGEDTAGRYAVWEAVVPPGGGPALHSHSREEEGFFVLDGEIAFRVDGETRVARAGTFANMPVGSVHGFKNETDRPARMLIWVAPAGLEKMFVEIGRPVPPGTQTGTPPTPEELAKLEAAAPRYGITLVRES